MQMLAKRPSERPPEAGKLSKALPDSVTAGMGDTVRLPREVIPPMAATHALARRRRLGRLEAIALAVALLDVLGGLASALLAPSGSSHRRPAARATVGERTGQPTTPKANHADFAAGASRYAACQPGSLRAGAAGARTWPDGARAPRAPGSEGGRRRGEDSRS